MMSASVTSPAVIAAFIDPPTTPSENRSLEALNLIRAEKPELFVRQPSHDMLGLNTWDAGRDALAASPFLSQTGS